MTRDLGIDGIRGLAILAVVIYHAALHASPDPEWGRWWKLGAQGVPVFFVVSGYLVALPWVRACLGHGPEPSLRDYWRRRILRLEPPWLICFAAYWLLQGYYACPWTVQHVLPTVAYQHQALLGTQSPLTPHSWSLEIEVRWYAAAPFVAEAFRWPRTHRRAALLAAVALLGGWPAHFLLGALVADLRLTGDELRGRWVAPLALAAILPVYALGWSLTPWLTALALMRPCRLPGALEGLGFRCYSVYLFHMLGQYWTPHPSERWLATAWLAATGVAAGLVGYRLVEVPARALLVPKASMSDMRASVPAREGASPWDPRKTLRWLPSWARSATT